MLPTDSVGCGGLDCRAAYALRTGGGVVTTGLLPADWKACQGDDAAEGERDEQHPSGHQKVAPPFRLRACVVQQLRVLSRQHVFSSERFCPKDRERLGKDDIGCENGS